VAERSLLLVDDEVSFRKLIARELDRSGFRVSQAGTLTEARHMVETTVFDLALLDLRLPDGESTELLKEIKETSPETEVVILTAYGTLPQAIAAVKAGAYDFLTKPCKFDELEAVLERAGRNHELRRTNAALSREVARLNVSEDLVGDTAPMRELREMIARVAATDSTVLITGESGTGKELIARAVHKGSARTKEPIVVVDCASLHENLLQSELFGHERGAYTGAVRMKQGLFEVADQGTIFLDEIGDIPQTVQVKLLRVIETGTLRRLGSTTDLRVNVRVIAATNRPLEQMMKEGVFREDLYYRLNVFSLDAPPLRKRTGDLRLLAEHFIRRSQIAGKRNTLLSPEALKVMERYTWPGNVRELSNAIERSLILCDAGVIQPEHLPMGVRGGTTPGDDMRDGRLLSLDEVERAHIRRVLDHCGGHRHRAAEILGISERNLYRRLKALDEDDADKSSTPHRAS